MARSRDYYVLYQYWAQVRRGQMVVDIQTQRNLGFPDLTEAQLYGKLRELSLYIWAIDEDRVDNLETMEADAILDRIVEICGTQTGIQLSNEPAVRTYDINDGTSINSALIVFANRFNALTDTFSSYTGKANYILYVNGGETGVSAKALVSSDSAYTPGAAGTTLTATNVQAAIDQVDANTIANGTSITAINTWKSDVDSTGTGIVVKFANSPTNPRYIKRTITASTNISITNGDGVSGNPTIATTLTPTYTTITTTGNATVGGNIIVAGLVDGVDISIADGLNLKRAGGQNTMNQDINMNALYKVMNMPAATANGEATRYEQVIRTTSDQAGITGVKEFSNQTVFAAAIQKDNIPLGQTVTVDPDEALIVGDGYAVNGTLDVYGDVFVIN